MDHHYHLVDVFTDRLFGGNPLAVFPDGDTIPPDLMPLIAREMNLSEITFVLSPRKAGHHSRIRIFTPQMELPFAGHPTIGTAAVLFRIGRIPSTGSSTTVTLEEDAGDVRVDIEERNGRLIAVLHVAQLPEFGPPPPSRNALADLLSIKPEDILDGPLRPAAVSCGVSYLFVPLVSRKALGRVRLNPPVWDSVLAGFWAPHLYVITEDVEFPGSSIRARMFAPAMGIAEDPATGAAASALAGYLVAAQGHADGMARWNIEQGAEMGRPSSIGVEADVSSLRVTGIRVRGETVHVGEGRLDLR